jgi:hypothetical protein
MKFPVLLMGLLMSSFFAVAQDSWRIVLNGKVVLTSHQSDETVNTKLIKSSEWKKNGYLEVTYKEMNPGMWHYTLQFSDETGANLLEKVGVKTARISTSTLRKLLRGKKQLKIYIVISPSDPKMAAPTRMIHLGTLKLP